MKLDGPNESFYAFLFEQVCLKHMDELSFSVKGGLRDNVLLRNQNEEPIGFKPIKVYIPKRIGSVLKWLGIGLLLSIIYTVILWWNKFEARQKYNQSYRFSAKSTPSSPNIFSYPQPSRSIVNLGL